MKDFQLIILITLSFVSMIPLINLYKHKASKDFKDLRIVSMLVFLWSLTMLIKYTVENSFIIYTMFLFVYPFLMLIVIHFAKSIFAYYRLFFPKPLTIGLYLYTAAMVLVVFTNDMHGLFMDVAYHANLTLETMLNAEPEILYLFHVILAYGLILYIFGNIIGSYIKSKDKKDRLESYVLFSLTLLIALLLNLYHIFIHTLHVDPTYISIVLFLVVIYHVIYRKDLFYAVLEGGRASIVKNMREYYILSDDKGYVIEVSERLQNRFSLAPHHYIDDLLERLKKDVVLYKDMNDLKDKTSNKPYLFMQKRNFSLPNLKKEGYLYLFYDETKVVNLIEQLERLQHLDLMTDIFNRNYLEAHIKAFEEKYSTFGIVLVDLNGLKLINDNFGHKAGDERLLKLVKQLKALERIESELTLIRTGGDEFLAFVPKASLALLKTLKETLIKHTHHKNPLKEISISVGIARRKTKRESFEKVFKRADNDLYIMKEETSKAYQERFLKRLKEKETKL